jgi:hypothetical protein
MLSFLNIFFICVISGIHPYHISVCDIEHDSEGRSLQVSQRVFLDDLEEVLNERFNVRIDVTNPQNPAYRDSLIQLYLFENIDIKVDGKNKKRSYLGNEIEEDGMWCYIEYFGVKKITTLEITNTVFFSKFDDQANIIHVKYEGKTKSLKLDRADPSGIFTMK